MLITCVMRHARTHKLQFRTWPYCLFLYCDYYRTFRELRIYDVTWSTTRSEFQHKNVCLVIYALGQMPKSVFENIFVNCLDKQTRYRRYVSNGKPKKLHLSATSFQRHENLTLLKKETAGNTFRCLKELKHLYECISY